MDNRLRLEGINERYIFRTYFPLLKSLEIQQCLDDEITMMILQPSLKSDKHPLRGRHLSYHEKKIFITKYFLLIH